MVKKWWGYLTAVSMLSLGLAFFIPQVALAVEQAPAPFPPQQLSSPSASNDTLTNYSWNVVADQGQLVVAVNYGKILYASSKVSNYVHSLKCMDKPH